MPGGNEINIAEVLNATDKAVIKIFRQQSRCETARISRQFDVHLHRDRMLWVRIHREYFRLPNYCHTESLHNQFWKGVPRGN